MQQPATARRFYSLDAVRGLAALAVVFFHWQHFSYHGTVPPSAPDLAGRYPLFFFFAPFYTDGWRAVRLFFCLSGFIFHWLYGQQIADGRVSWREFALLRFSRLYPLHLITLLITLAGQAWAVRASGSFFAYRYNDLYHFCLHLVFAFGWGLERGGAFNTPIWSVSVEVLLYAVFFVTSALKWHRPWQLLLLVVFGQLILGVNEALGCGFLSFFIGGLTFEIFKKIRGFASSKWVPAGSALLCTAAWVTIPFITNRTVLYDLYTRHFWKIGLFGRDVVGHFLLAVAPYPFEMILFPLTILTLALIETHLGTFGKRIAFLGDISYSTYLLHFPLQLLMFCVAVHFGVAPDCFSTPAALLLYFAILIPISLGSYWCVERPCQHFLRTRFAGLTSSAETTEGALNR